MVMKKLASVAATLALLAARADAQVIFDVETKTFNCPNTGGKYCAEDSLTSNIIVRCAGFIGDPEDCRFQLFGILPVGIKHFASCYQLDSAIGNASCSSNGIVYPENGKPFPIQHLSTPATPPATRKLKVSAAASPESADISHEVKLAKSASSGRDTYGPTVTERVVRPLPQLVAEEIATPLPFVSPTSSEIPIPQSTLGVGLSIPVREGTRDCNDSDILPEFALEGICNIPGAKPDTTTPLPFVSPAGPKIPIPQSTLEAGLSIPVREGTRDCNDSDILPEFALEGICNIPGAKRDTTKPLPFVNPTGSKISIPRSTLGAGLSIPVREGTRDCNDSDILPEFALEGICNIPGAKPEPTIGSTSNPYRAKRELAVNSVSNPSNTGSANMNGVGLCTVGAGVLAFMSFVLAN